ncbi:lytic transglycosylase domain-containing protein [Salmonella enterica]|nr:lytic transglycosylase domain-containing protein [Salmonella enterica]EBI1908738.1 lytic transglycosylase domain-containing protein [Salmonella enterica]EDY6032452.1 lytic transglycosylase domain-containing protein [Salmonella enterica]MLG27063.1 lytic transglycosylase domain-containing protein [Salmonella enterica]
MSDESSVEKFVLEYNVQVNGGKKLEDLEKGLDDVSKKGKSTGKEISSAAKTINGEFTKLTDNVPGLNQLTSKLSGLSGEAMGVARSFTAIAAPAAIAYVAIKKIAEAANAYNQQYQQMKLVGWEAGMSPIAVAQQQKTLNAAGGLSGEETNSLLGKVSGKITAAYTNIDPMSREALQLRAAGVDNYRQPGGQRLSTATAIDEMARKLQSVNESVAKGIGQSIGLTEREVEALRKRNTAVVEATKLSDDEIATRQAANVAAERLQAANNKLDMVMERIKTRLEADMVPIWAEFIDEVADFVDSMDKGIDGLIESAHDFVDWANAAQEKILHPYDNRDKTIEEIYNRFKAERVINEAAAKKAEREAEKTKSNADNMTMAINMFGASVNTFVGAVDKTSDPKYQAAYLGSIGRDMGLQGLGVPNVPVGGHASIGGYGIGSASGSGKSIEPAKQYDAYIEKYFPAEDKDTIRAMIMQESKGRTDLVSSAGAFGPMQVMPQNFDKLAPGANRNDLDAQFRVAAQIWADAKRYAAKNGGSLDEALRYYNGGIRRGSKENQEYAGKVRSYLPAQVIDATKGFDGDKASPKARDMETYRREQGVDELARYMQVPPQQILRGEIPKEDIQIAVKQMLFDASRSQQIAQTKVDSGVFRSDIEKNAARQQLIAANKSLSAAQSASGFVGGVGNSDQRTYTFNNTFNVAAYGGDASAIGQSVGGHVINGMKDQINQVHQSANTVVER